MTPTIDYLRSQFHTFNAQYFEGALPEPAFRITNARTILGQYVCTCRTKWWRLAGKPQGCTIKISRYYDMPEREYQNTLLHEMIHYYISYKQIKDTSPHGKVFRQMMQRLNDAGWGISVRTGTAGFDLANKSAKLKRKYVLALRTTAGRCYLSVVQPKAIAQLETLLRRVPDVEEHSWFVTCDDYFRDFPSVRTLRARWVADDVYRRLVSEMERVDF